MLQHENRTPFISCYLSSFIRELSRNNRIRTCQLALHVRKTAGYLLLLRAFREIFFSDVIKDLNALINAHTFSQHYFRHKKTSQDII